MKNLRSIIAILAISLSTVFAAHANDNDNELDVTKKVTKELRTELVQILGSKIPLQLNATTKAEVSFMITEKNEVLVVSVDSKNKAFDSYVKNKLNYKKIKVAGVKKGEVYRVPVKINAAK